MIQLRTFRKVQAHSPNNRVQSLIGDSTFIDFNNDDVLAGDSWRCSSDEQVVNNVVGNPVVYKGDKVMAMVDNPGPLNWENINNGNWDISRRIPIPPGTRITARDGGQEGVETYDDDYRYICVQSGIPESLPGRRDGTAIWKKSSIAQSN